jgi:hypothetical protein
MKINAITLLLFGHQYLEASPANGISNEERSLHRFACRQSAIIGHFRRSFLKEADCAEKGSSLKD